MGGADEGDEDGEAGGDEGTLCGSGADDGELFASEGEEVAWGVVEEAFEGVECLFAGGVVAAEGGGEHGAVDVSPAAVAEGGEVEGGEVAVADDGEIA